MARSPRPKLKATSVKRSTIDTKFHIDYDWWAESELDLKSYIYTRLPAEREINLDPEVNEVDLVDPNTGEVNRVDGFNYVVQTFFSELTDDSLTRMPIAEAAFYVLLGNANQPLTPVEIGARLHRAPETVLRTLGGTVVYQGIRPILS